MSSDKTKSATPSRPHAGVPITPVAEDSAAKKRKHRKDSATKERQCGRDKKVPKTKKSQNLSALGKETSSTTYRPLTTKSQPVVDRYDKQLSSFKLSYVSKQLQFKPYASPAFIEIVCNELKTTFGLLRDRVFLFTKVAKALQNEQSQDPNFEDSLLLPSIHYGIDLFVYDTTPPGYSKNPGYSKKKYELSEGGKSSPFSSRLSKLKCKDEYNSLSDLLGNSKAVTILNKSKKADVTDNQGALISYETMCRYLALYWQSLHFYMKHVQYPPAPLGCEKGPFWIDRSSFDLMTATTNYVEGFFEFFDVLVGQESLHSFFSNPESSDYLQGRRKSLLSTRAVTKFVGSDSSKELVQPPDPTTVERLLGAEDSREKLFHELLHGFWKNLNGKTTFGVFSSLCLCHFQGSAVLNTNEFYTFFLPQLHQNFFVVVPPIRQSDQTGTITLVLEHIPFFMLVRHWDALNKLYSAEVSYDTNTIVLTSLYYGNVESGLISLKCKQPMVDPNRWKEDLTRAWLFLKTDPTFTQLKGYEHKCIQVYLNSLEKMDKLPSSDLKDCAEKVDEIMRHRIKPIQRSRLIICTDNFKSSYEERCRGIFGLTPEHFAYEGGETSRSTDFYYMENNGDVAGLATGILLGIFAGRQYKEIYLLGCSIGLSFYETTLPLLHQLWVLAEKGRVFVNAPTDKKETEALCTTVFNNIVHLHDSKTSAKFLDSATFPADPPIFYKSDVGLGKHAFSDTRSWGCFNSIGHECQSVFSCGLDFDWVLFTVGATEAEVGLVLPTGLVLLPNTDAQEGASAEGPRKNPRRRSEGTSGKSKRSKPTANQKGTSTKQKGSTARRKNKNRKAKLIYTNETIVMGKSDILFNDNTKVRYKYPNRFVLTTAKVVPLKGTKLEFPKFSIGDVVAIFKSVEFMGRYEGFLLATDPSCPELLLGECDVHSEDVVDFDQYDVGDQITVYLGEGQIMQVNDTEDPLGYKVKVTRAHELVDKQANLFRAIYRAGTILSLPYYNVGGPNDVPTYTDFASLVDAYYDRTAAQGDANGFLDRDDDEDVVDPVDENGSGNGCEHVGKPAGNRMDTNTLPLANPTDTNILPLASLHYKAGGNVSCRISFPVLASGEDFVELKTHVPMYGISDDQIASLADVFPHLEDDGWIPKKLYEVGREVTLFLGLGRIIESDDKSDPPRYKVQLVCDESPRPPIFPKQNTLFLPYQHVGLTHTVEQVVECRLRLRVGKIDHDNDWVEIQKPIGMHGMNEKNQVWLEYVKSNMIKELSCLKTGEDVVLPLGTGKIVQCMDTAKHPLYQVELQDTKDDHEIFPHDKTLFLQYDDVGSLGFGKPSAKSKESKERYSTAAQADTPPDHSADDHEIFPHNKTLFLQYNDVGSLGFGKPSAISKESKERYSTAAQADTPPDHSAVNRMEKKIQTATAAYTMLESQLDQMRSELKQRKATAETVWSSPTSWSVVNKLFGRSDPISDLEKQLQEAEKKRTAAKKDVDRLMDARRKEQLAKEAQNRANRLLHELPGSRRKEQLAKEAQNQVNRLIHELPGSRRKEQLAKEAQNRANRLLHELPGSQDYFLNRSVNVPGYTSTSTLSDTQKSLFKASVEGSTESEDITPRHGVVDTAERVDDSSSDDSSS